MKIVSIISFLSIVFISCSKSVSTTPVIPYNGPYFPKVKSIIQANCITCHDPNGTWQGRPTDLSSDDKIVQIAGTIKAAVADPPTLTIHHMPQGGNLSQADIDIIVKWFNKGGKATD